MKRLRVILEHKKTLFLALVAFVLPWQTRYLFGGVLVGDVVSQFTMFSLYATECLLLVGAVALLRTWRWTNYRSVVFAVFGFVAIVLLSAVCSRFGFLAIHAVTHIAFAALFLVLLLDDDVRVRPVVMAFVGGLIAPAFLGAYQILAGESGSSTLFGLAARDAEQLGDAVVVIDGERVLRAYGSFPHPNIFGGYFALAVAMSVVVFSGRVRWALGGFTVVALLMTASRAALLAAVLAFMMFVGLSYARERAWMRRMTVVSVLLVLVASLASVFVAPGALASLRGGGATEERSVIERVEQYAIYPEVIRGANLFVGLGPGTYVSNFALVEPGKSVWVYQPIHNALLLMIAEIGVLGALAVAAVGKKVRDVTRGSVVLPSFVAALAALVIFDHYLWSMWPGLVLFAFALGVGIRATEQSA